MSEHFIEKCEVCDKVIGQCRCMDYNKTVQYSICNPCLLKLKTGNNIPKPCPFCGSKAKVVKLPNNEYLIQCTKIGNCYGRHHTDGEGYTYENDAIEVWNRRVEDRKLFPKPEDCIHHAMCKWVGESYCPGECGHFVRIEL